MVALVGSYAIVAACGRNFRSGPGPASSPSVFWFHTNSSKHMLRVKKLFFVILCAIATTIEPLVAQTVNAGTPEFFENKIRPILANNCFGCHTNSQLGNLRLDTLEAMKKGGKRGPA